MRYTYYNYTDQEGRTVTACVSRYAGKSVKGTAKCVPTDQFDETVGKKLSRARCDERIALKKMNHARDQIEQLKVLRAIVNRELCKAESRHEAAYDEYIAATDIIEMYRYHDPAEGV